MPNKVCALAAPSVTRLRPRLTRTPGGGGLTSAAERFALELASGAADAAPEVAGCAATLAAAEAKLAELQAAVDALYRDTFAAVEVSAGEADEGERTRYPALSEAAFAALGRDDPAAFARLLAAGARADRARFADFQAQAQRLLAPAAELSGASVGTRPPLFGFGF